MVWTFNLSSLWKMSTLYAPKNVFLTITSKLFKSHRVKFSKNQTLSQNNSTPNTTLSKGLAMFCANFTMIGFATNLVLIPIASLPIGSWMNLLFLNPKDNPQFCYLSYNSILINWRLHFCEPLFHPWSPLGELTYLGQCNHLPKVAWGSLSPNVHCCHNWNIWPWKGFALPS